MYFQGTKIDLVTYMERWQSWLKSGEDLHGYKEINV